MKKSRIKNFIMDASQVLLLFVGIYSAIMCAMGSVSVPFNNKAVMITLLVLCILFHILFTMLETFKGGKMYGVIGIVVFAILAIIRYLGEFKKGVFNILNTYTKEFMNYTQSSQKLIPVKSFEGVEADINYCDTLVIIIVFALITAIISSNFYRKRKAGLYLLLTGAFFLGPICVGKVGEFKYVIMYLMTTFAVIGSRRLKDDITDKRLRQKISLILAGLGLGIGLIVYIIVPPDRYERHTADITEVKNTLISLGSMDADEIFVFFKSMMKGDALSYGRVGDTASINYTGEKLMVLSGEFQRDHGMYLKGYVGGEFIDNRWRQVTTNREQYDKDLKSLKDDGLSVDDWQVALRNQIGDSQTTGNPNLWREGTLKIKNLGFGRGDYVAPYYPSTGFVTEQGKIKPHEPGLVYSEKYLAEICSTFRGELWANQYNVANEVFWKSVESNKNRLQDFVNKYYLTVPTSMDNTVKNYKDYMVKQNQLLDKYKAGFASMYQVITATKEYVMSRTDYTLSPGKTPSDVDFVEYFLDKNKKGYCEHYATATALLLRSVGIPTRYVEGAFVSKEQISDAVNSSDEVDVKDNDLHAWIEVYHPNYGFIPVETTPGRGEEESIQSGGSFDDGLPNPDANSGKDKKDNKEKKNKKDKEEEKTEMSAATATPRPEENMEFENIDTKNYNHDDGEDHSQEMDNGTGEDGQNISNSENVPKTLPLFVKIIILVVGILLAFAFAMEIQRRVRFAMYKAKLSRSRGREKILVHYRHLEKVFRADGIRYKGQSMADYAQEIASHYDCRIDDVYEMVRMTFEASFSQNDFDKSRVKEYKRMVRTMRNRIYAGRKGFAKLYLMYILDI